MEDKKIDTSLAYKTKQIIKKYEFNFKKRFGQNFLVDQHVLNKIIQASEITENDLVIEVGPGIGTLTAELAKHAYKVIAVEIDSTLIPILEQTLSEYNNIEIINEDILKVDILKIAQDYSEKTIKIVANLPYYITTPIIMEILENHLPIKSITVMIQKEVAYRMKAEPSTKDYGSLSLNVQYYCKPYLVANVPQNCFMPRPNVDSAVIKLTILDKPPVECSDAAFMFRLIKTAFSQRRKTLLNCIYNSNEFNFTKEQISEFLIDAQLDVQVRGETLTLKEFAKLTELMRGE